MMSKPKAAIIYLVKGDATHHWLEESLSALHHFFNHRYQYPILVFHECLSTNQQNALLNITPIQFIQILDFLTLPPFPGLSLEQVHRWVAGLDGGRGAFPLGYRQMCRFFLNGLLDHPAMIPYDYYWRFDDDSFLLEKIPYDPFQVMQDQGYVYGYRCIEFENTREPGMGLDFLWKTTTEFAKANHLKTRHLKKLTADWKGKYKGFNYYNNFEINQISFWRSHSLYRKYFETLDRTLGFYKYRWGDANVRALSVGLFLNPNQVFHFKDIGYRHNDHYAIQGSDRVMYKKSS